MDLKQLRYFAAVVRMGSFRKAAETVHISQPALSLSIKDLESKLDVKLLERGPGKLVPTSFGKALYKHSHSIERSVQAALDEINQLRGVGEGQVAIGISPFVGTDEMGSLIGQFIDRYPGIHIRTDHGIYSWSLSRLVEGDIDFFFAEVPEHSSKGDVVHQELFRLPYGLICGKNHPLANKKSLSLKSILDYRLAYGKEWAAEIHGWSEAFEQAKLDQPESFIDVAATEFYINIARECDVIVLHPLTGFMLSYLESGELVQLNVQGTDWHSVIGLVHRKNQAFSPAAQLLFDEIKERMPKLANMKAL